ERNRITAIVPLVPPERAVCRVRAAIADQLIYTLRGDCGSVRAAVRIVGGRVYSEDQSYQSNGAVGANGVIRVTVAGFGRSASGSGRLSHNSGAGRWWSSRGESRRAGYY